jgi:hypothetical protein
LRTAGDVAAASNIMTRTYVGVSHECRIDLRKPKEAKGIGEMGLAGEDGV